MGTGPDRLSAGLHPSTVHRVLTRYGLAKLRWLDRPTGRVIRRISRFAAGTWSMSTSRSWARSRPAAAGRCWATWPADTTPAPTKHRHDNRNYQPLRGYHFLHTAIDGHSRLAYTELLGDERKGTAAAFWLRANAWFAERVITVRNMLTDNGSCYRSRTFADTLGEIQHRRTRPPSRLARPQAQAAPRINPPRPDRAEVPDLLTETSPRRHQT